MLDEVYERVYDQLAEVRDEELLSAALQVAVACKSKPKLGKPKSPSSKHVAELKNAAVKAFQAKNYQLAVRLYSELLEFVSLSDLNEVKQQSHAGRSAALQRLNLSNECIDDVEMAIELSPKPQEEFLLLERKGKCLAESGRAAEAIKCLSQSVIAVEKAQNVLPKVKELFSLQAQSLANKLREEELEVKTKTLTFKETLMSEVRKSHSKQFSSLSDKAVVAWGGRDRGRFIMAAQDVRAGDLVAFESPLVSFTSCASDGLVRTSMACHHCLDPFACKGALFYPSSYVKGVRFCTSKCAREADKYHKYEEPFMKELLSDDQSEESDMIRAANSLFLALRAVLKAPFEELLHEEEPQADLGTKNELLEGDGSAEWQLCRSLVRHQEACCEEERLQAAARACTLVIGLDNNTTFFQDLVSATRAEGTFARRVTLKHIYDLQFAVAHNAHKVYALDGRVSGDIPLKSVGSALYRSLVLGNHSCAPNTARFYVGGKMALVARRGIKKGQEIANCYGPYFSQMAKVERREKLEHDYKFTCQCEACNKDLPMLADQASAISPKSLQKALNRLMDAYRRAFANNERQMALRSAIEYLRRLEQVTFPHRAYDMGAVAMNSCWWALAADDQ